MLSPPDQSVEEVTTFMSNFEESFDLAFAKNPESTILLGDLNDTCSIWDSDHRKSELGLKLYDFINNHDLHLLIQSPTHILPYFPFTANILDLIITDSPGYIANINQNHLPPSAHTTKLSTLSWKSSIYVTKHTLVRSGTTN